MPQSLVLQVISFVNGSVPKVTYRKTNSRSPQSRHFSIISILKRLQNFKHGSPCYTSPLYVGEIFVTSSIG